MDFRSLVRTTQCRHGQLSYLSTDTTVGRSLETYGEWAEAEVRLFQKIVRPGDVVLEAGANIGTHTIPLAQLVGELGWVHAFEPVYFTHQLLCSNIVENRTLNVQTYQATLGPIAKLGDFPFTTPLKPENFGGIGHYAPLGQKTASAEFTIDQLDLTRLDFLKIDVEGYEREVMKGGLETIRRCQPAIFVETVNDHALKLDNYGHVGWVEEILESLGYKCWHYITPLYNPDNWLKEQNDHFAGKWSFDLICLPRKRGEIIGLPAASDLAYMYHADPVAWRGAELHPATT